MRKAATTAAEMKKRLAHLPAYFLGPQDDESLSRLYASSDLLVFPSRTDTLGQVVMEALLRIGRRDHDQVDV